MLFRSVVVVLLAATVSARAYAQDEAPKYLHSVVSALGWSNEAIKAFDRAERIKGPGGKIEILYANKTANDNYRKARAEIEPYTESSMKMIVESAKGLVAAFDAYSKICFDWDALQHDLATAEGDVRTGKIDNPEAALAGFQERTAELKFRSDKIGELLGTAVSGASWAAYQADDGGMPRYPLLYAVSPDERARLVKELTATFGKSVAAGPETGQSYLEISAAMLCKVLTQGETKATKKGRARKK